MKNIKIGLIGLGTVGTGVVKLLQKTKSTIAKRTGIFLDIAGIADIDIKKKKLFPAVFTTDAYNLIKNPEIDIIVELIGGNTSAKNIILDSIKYGKHIVTANKALLAEYCSEIFHKASLAGVHIGFEGSCGGGIPIIKILLESFIPNKIDKIFAIINGTTNYILSKMTYENKTFEQALSEAKKMGYAESNPTLDINGTDAAHKLLILSSYSFASKINFGDIFIEGIKEISLKDIIYAKDCGYTVKLLSIGKRIGNELELRVQPTMIPSKHLLSAVRDEFNAIYIEGQATGAVMFYGKGAGAFPTANSVISDLIDIGKKITSGYSNVEIKLYDSFVKRKIRKPEEFISRYYFRFGTVDRPGVLSKISGILGKYNISISSVIQKESASRNIVPIVMLTHRAREKDVQNSIKFIDKLPEVKTKTVVIRIEDTLSDSLYAASWR